MTKTFRKEPCPCGSGRKYKRCCGVNANHTRSLAEELTIALNSIGLRELLLSLASVAVLPENQGQEFRFLHLALMLLDVTCQTSSDQSQGLEAIEIICSKYDSEYGPLWPMNEYDFKNILYLSWFNVRGRGSKMLSGTLAEPELYYQETLHRLFPLDSLMQTELGFSFPTFLALFIQRGHEFLVETGLSEFDQVCAGDWSQQISFGQLDLAKAIREAFEKHYVFNRGDLKKEQLSLLNFLSQPSSSYSSDLNLLMSGQSDFHNYPVVQLANQFIVPFPQLLLPAICNRVWHALGDRPDAQESHEKSSQDRLVNMLVKRFGIELIFPVSPDIQDRLGDVVVLLDQKVLCFQVGSGADRLHAAIARAQRAQTIWNEHKDQGDLGIDAIHMSINLPDLADLEIIHLIVFALQEDSAMTAPIEKAEAIFEIFSFRELEYLFEKLDSELDFIKFLRAKERLHRAGGLMFGDNLDCYSLYADSGTMLPTHREGKVTGIMVDPMSFSSMHLEDLKKFRRKHRIYGKEQRFLRYHYPGAWKGIDKDANYFFAFDFEYVKVTLKALFPGDDEALFRAWHVSLEALSYHLGTRRNDIEERLRSLLPDVSAVEIIVKAVYQGEPATFEKIIAANKIMINVTLSSEIAALFMRGNNDGESTLINGLLKGIGLITEDENDSLYLAASKVRRTQLFPYRIPHKSFAEPTEAIKIYKADRRLVERLETEALSTGKIKPGSWKTKDDMMKILSIVFRALHQEFQSRIDDMSCEELVKLSYHQLEAAYIESEHAKMQLAISAQTAEFVDIEQRYLETTRQAVELSFAIKLILEKALQLSTESKKHVTEEKYTELLALAGRLVELDFEGDMICMFVPNELNVMSVELDKYGVVRLVGGKDLANPAGGHMFKGHKSSMAAPNAIDSQSQTNSFPKDEFLQSFNEPFKEVFGYSLSDRIEITSALLQIFDERDSPILDEDKTKVIEAVCVAANKKSIVVQEVLKELTLTREHLSELKTISPSTGYWRGARILNRPIIQLGKNILVTRMVLDLSLQVFIRRLAAGRYVPEAKDASLLTKEIGRWRNFAGEHFRTSIVDLFSAHGFEAYPEVDSLNSVGIPREGISGVDIIAIDKKSHLILVVECKDIEMSKNPKDLNNEVFNFFLNDKEPSYSQRTRNKWEWINNNRNHLYAEYKLNSADSWCIEPLLVTSDYLWSQLLVDSEVLVRSKQELNEWLIERT